MTHEEMLESWRAMGFEIVPDGDVEGLWRVEWDGHYVGYSNGGCLPRRRMITTEPEVLSDLFALASGALSV